MRKEVLSDQLRGPITKAVNDFVNQKSDKAIAAEKELKKLEAMRDTLSADSPALAGIEQAIDSFDSGDEAYIKERREDAALAVVMLCNELRLPVQMKAKSAKSAAGASSGGSPARRNRIDKTQREAAEKALLKVLKGGKSLTRSEIIDLTGMDGPMYTAVTRSLKNEGDIVTEGRGRAATLRLS